MNLIKKNLDLQKQYIMQQKKFGLSLRLQFSLLDLCFKARQTPPN